MIIATLLLAVGLLVGAWAATTRGYRLGGVVVVSLLAVYTLVDVVAFPVFAVSTLMAYIAIGQIQDRWLLFGRPLLLSAVLVGAVLPLVTVVGLDALLGGTLVVRHMDYIGTILPGIAAYNFYRVDPTRRRLELAVSGALYAGLLVLGVVAVYLWGYPPRLGIMLFGVSPAEFVWPILLTNGADVAAGLGLTTQIGQPIVGSLAAVSVVVLGGLALTEFVRDRYGLLAAGVIALPLLALFALRAWWVLPIYAAIVGTCFVIVEILHRRTLLYGRALLSVAAVGGVTLGLLAAVSFVLTDMVTVFFIGLLGGIGGFNLHTTAAPDRPATMVVTAGLFVLIFVIERIVVAPLDTGLTATVDIATVIVCGTVLAAALWVLVRRERSRPAVTALYDAALPAEVA